VLIFHSSFNQKLVQSDNGRMNFGWLIGRTIWVISFKVGTARLCRSPPSSETTNHDLVVVTSSPNCVPHCSKEPENQSNYEHNHSDCPYNRKPCDEPNEEKNQTENNHNASSTRT